MANPRCNLVSLQCPVCRRVWNGAEWLPERRQVTGEMYAQGLCDGCKTQDTPGAPGDDPSLQAPVGGA